MLGVFGNYQFRYLFTKDLKFRLDIRRFKLSKLNNEELKQITIFLVRGTSFNLKQLDVQR